MKKHVTDAATGERSTPWYEARAVHTTRESAGTTHLGPATPAARPGGSLRSRWVAQRPRRMTGGEAHVHSGTRSACARSDSPREQMTVERAEDESQLWHDH